jgi:hypothetical protein
VKLFGWGKSANEPEFTSSADDETKKRSREIQLLVNLIEPDPKMQPWFISDEGRVFDICSLEEDEIRRRLGVHFRGPIHSNLEAPLWKFVDLLKAEFPGWPDNPPWQEP